jgi:hypothetical protein
LYVLRGLLSLLFFGAALGLTAGIALGVGSAAYKALTYSNKKDKNFDYNSYGYSQYADKSDAFALG